MDIATLGGFIGAIVFIIVSILLGGVLNAFIDLPSVMITIGGSVAASFIAYPLPSALAAIKGIKHAFVMNKQDPIALIKKLVELSNRARKEGLLSLEEFAGEIDDKLLKKGILLVVDGTDQELVQSVLETDISYLASRHSQVYGYWEKLGELAPAWGMIGTLVGLINMLRNLSDPTTIGPSMAVALITTFYGSLIANMIALPVASKMKIRSAAEISIKELMIEGILSIQAGENPKILEEKLKSFLSPALCLAYESGPVEEGESNG